MGISYFSSFFLFGVKHVFNFPLTLNPDMLKCVNYLDIPKTYSIFVSTT